MAADFVEGQIWSYRTRSGEEGSTLIIDKIEIGPKQMEIFHISVRGIRPLMQKNPEKFTDMLPHLPVGRQTLETSAVTLIGFGSPDPNYVDGYKEWKKAFEKGEAGIWTVAVSEIITVLEQALAR